MVTRRKLWGLMASAAGALGIGVPAAAAPLSSGAAVSPDSADFARYQKWFRDHPSLLWATPFSSGVELVRQKAVRMSEPFHDANPHIEYSAWVDKVHDVLVLKVYHRDRDADIEVGLDVVITRKGLSDLKMHDTYIDDAWTELTNAVNGRPLPSEWNDYSAAWPDKTITGCRR